MGAVGTLSRTPGTGNVKREGGKWAAYEPPRDRGKAQGPLIGRFDTKFHAHRAADKWFAARSAERQAG